jgi:hypothetical protein
MSTEYTFDELTKLEPRLGELEADAAQAARDGRGDRGWSPARCFDRYFGWRIRWIVGASRKCGGGDATVEGILRSSRVFDLVCIRIRDTLRGAAIPPEAA